MFFRRKKPTWLKNLLKEQEMKEAQAPQETETFLIEREMMLKGADVPRGNKIVKQFAVMVNGSVHVVTSGDRVSRAVYEALLEANAIIPIPGVEVKQKNLASGTFRIEDETLSGENG
ncbi:MAG: hypothetical protein N3G21_11840 [Candidatus Hydrogenedentes bacterium]|nr:hypothetical protein [Candidatus Hydrogenedentota bacterium]